MTNQVAIWPCGTWCELEDIEEYSWMSDDYELTTISDEDWEEMNQT